MKTYTCPRCTHTFHQLSNYKRHLKASNMCDPINGDISLEDEKRRIFIEKDIKYTCEDCKKGFSTKKGLDTHIGSHCKKVVYIPRSNNKIDVYVKESSNNISLNNFGYETISHIDDDFIKDVIREGSDGIIKLFKHIYMNPYYPENKTYIIKNLHSEFGLKFVDNKWIKTTTYFLVERMVNYTIIVLKTRILKLNIEYSEKDAHYIYFCSIGKNTLSRIRKAVLLEIVSSNNNTVTHQRLDTSVGTLSEPSPCLYEILDPPQLPSVSNH